jgi:hypothetical protein
VAEYHYDFCSRDPAPEFHAPQYVFVDNISSDTDAENIPEPLVEYQLGRRPAVDTAQHNGKRPLAVRCVVHLLEQVPVDFQIFYESFVSFLQYVQSL